MTDELSQEALPKNKGGRPKVGLHHLNQSRPGALQRERLNPVVFVRAVTRAHSEPSFTPADLQAP